ncbi:hypothetical protein TWF225_001413 [Orbilia oligospora]|nr:hypothetical protein TWF751_008949 [Orbilia oligospora]KAF3191268.1 hypothetical protein TWF225_001413 [Orbilia oligospora]KAF3269445.1 hypothetical protein TWF128_005669 [Orbilia oligospora]
MSTNARIKPAVLVSSLDDDGSDPCAKENTGYGVDDITFASLSLSVPVLPPEILHLIFRYLVPAKTTLYNLCLASKQFKDIAIEYLYRGEVRLHFDQDVHPEMDLDHFLSLPDTESKTIKSLFISSFPERPSRQTVKAEIMAVKLKNFLLKLQPDQLDTFVLNGWGIDNYLQYFPGEPFLRQQTGIRKVCLPLASLFWSQGASERVLTPGIFPNLESLYVSDMCYLSHIRDVWTIIEDKGETLKSLAILCPLGSQLKSFLGYPDMFSNPYTFLQIEVALKVLRDLYIYGFPNLGRFLNDCARNLIDYKILRSLRLEQCPRIESLLQTICNIEEMPSLKSLQLIETCSPETFETIIPRLSPLDTLYIIFPREQNLPKYDMIKYYHSKTLRRVWIEHKNSSYVLDNTVRTIKFKLPPDNGYDGFFLTSWPLLEEVALGIDLVRDNRPIILPENLRVLRIVGTPRFANGALYEPARDALAIAKKHVYHTSIKNKQPRLAVIAFFTLIPPPIYVTAQHPIIYLVDYVREEDKLIPILRLTDIGAVRWLFPDMKIMEFERRDKPWADDDGSLW